MFCIETSHGLPDIDQGSWVDRVLFDQKSFRLHVLDLAVIRRDLIPVAISSDESVQIIPVPFTRDLMQCIRVCAGSQCKIEWRQVEVQLFPHVEVGVFSRKLVIHISPCFSSALKVQHGLNGVTR